VFSSLYDNGQLAIAEVDSNDGSIVYLRTYEVEVSISWVASIIIDGLGNTVISGSVYDYDYPMAASFFPNGTVNWFFFANDGEAVWWDFLVSSPDNGILMSWDGSIQKIFYKSAEY
jgi:hypothetical protein